MPTLPLPPDVVPLAADFHPECDAGDEAWVRRAVVTLLGRPPRGSREVRVLADLVRVLGRAAVADSLMRDAPFGTRWRDFLMDDVWVERAGVREQESCYGRPERSAAGPGLAEFIRDNAPGTAAPGGAFDMADVVAASIELDDLTPFYRAALFPMMSRPLVSCKNLTPAENDLARRRAFGNAFGAVYLHRNIECLRCHNSDGSPTMSDDPAKNRFFPPPGPFERAMWEKKSGRAFDETITVFRSMGVVTQDMEKMPDAPHTSEEVQPWALSTACGRFMPAESIGDDPVGTEGWFGGALGKRGSVWRVEAMLHEGFDGLRRTHQPFPDTDTMEPPQALASLVSQGIVQDVWKEVFGSPLVLSHGFPRNAAQREVLVDLTTSFVASGWSLKKLLRLMVTHPLFNQKAAGDRCGATAYDLPPVLDPWSVAEETPDRRPNSLGDAVLRPDARTLLRAVSAAMDWEEPPAFPDLSESSFQVNVGARLGAAQLGYEDPSFQQLLLWEDRFGSCERPKFARRDPSNDLSNPMSCVGRCGHTQRPTDHSCSCDEACTSLHDCCSDYSESCPASPEEKAPADWMDRIEALATTGSLRDAVDAVRDRIWSEGGAGVHEEPLLRKFFGVSSLDVPFERVSNRDGLLRRYCGVLVKAPQFMLQGAPAPASVPISAPKLVEPGDTYHALCEHWAKYTAVQPSVRCGNESIEAGQPAIESGARATP
jgi:hypothetical protein